MAAVTLQILEGLERGATFRGLDTPVTIGREDENSVRLNDERVSRFHAKLQEDDGRILLTDLDSTNGTRVNGRPVSMRVLRPGDQLAIGRCLLTYGSPEEIAAAFAPDAAAPLNGPPVSGPPVFGSAVSGPWAGWPGGGAGPKTPPHGTPPPPTADGAAGAAPGGAAVLAPPAGAPPTDDPDPAAVASEGAPAFDRSEPGAAQRVAVPFLPPGERPAAPDRLSPAQTAQLCDLLGYVHEEILRVALAARDLPTPDPDADGAPPDGGGGFGPGPDSDGSGSEGSGSSGSGSDSSAVGGADRLIPAAQWQRLMRVEMDLAEVLRRLRDPD